MISVIELILEKIYLCAKSLNVFVIQNITMHCFFPSFYSSDIREKLRKKRRALQDSLVKVRDDTQVCNLTRWGFVGILSEI